MAVLRESVVAPEFPEGLEWLNTDHPLRLADLRGKIVLLDFWTYCCINCMHVIPDLKRLERKYPQELVVIGVHSAKFTAERDTDNIRAAVLRYEIEHPVVNDSAMRVWHLYGVRSWPTLVLLDPTGKTVSQKSGEGAFEAFDGAIGELVATFDAKGQLDRRSLALKPERERVAPSLLSFPGKVLVDEASQRLFISDTGHNRLLVVSLRDNTITDTIGRGEAGLADGDFAEAAFDHPQGLALAGDVLYVADTENHALRRVALSRRRVETIAGTGGQAAIFNRSGPGPATALNSPWDLVAHNGMLYVAMAGSHQLWRMNLATQYAQPHAGSGREGRVDGPLLAAALAQPSGLATDGAKLYFADSEVSAIRSADLDPSGRVETIVGGDLFDFGDRDGRGLEVRLQHPLALAFHRGDLYVADTYNNKIKRVRLADQSCETFLGTGEGGLRDGERAMFYEPGGLAAANGNLYIADTNNHAIRVADLATGGVETLDIRLPSVPPTVGGPPSDFQGESIALPAQRIGPGDGTMTIALELPPGCKLNAEAPNVLSVTSSNPTVVALSGTGERTVARPTFPVELPLSAQKGDVSLTVDLALYYCPKGEDVCCLKEVRLILPVRVGEDQANHALNCRADIRR